MTTSAGAASAEVAERLGRGDGVAPHEGDGRRALEQRDEVGEPGLLGRPAGQRVLEDLVLGGRRAQRAAQVGQLGDRQAAVLGEDRRVGFVELGADLVDDGDLLGSRHVRAPDWIVT